MKIFKRKPSSAKHPNYRAHEVEYRPNFALWMILVGIFLLGLWASWAELDQITRAQGQVIASSRTQIIQSPDGGILEEMLVKEGDTVSKGQVLARLDRAKVEAAFFEAQSKVAALTATVARLRAEVFGGQPNFGDNIKGYPQFKENQILLLKKRRQAIN
ncbi:MAG: biotin/lipoyl-binding protein, partial [Methylotenera sp.]